MNNNYYCKECGSVVQFTYKQTTTICPNCGKELMYKDIMPGWVRDTRIEQLKAMHTLMCSANDEDITMDWLSLGVPDCPSDEDYIDIALDDENYNEIFDLFVELIKNEDVRW